MDRGRGRVKAKVGAKKIRRIKVKRIKVRRVKDEVDHGTTGGYSHGRSTSWCVDVGICMWRTAVNILVSYRGIPQSPGWATGDAHLSREVNRGTSWIDLLTRSTMERSVYESHS